MKDNLKYLTSYKLSFKFNLNQSNFLSLVAVDHDRETHLQVMKSTINPCL